MTRVQRAIVLSVLCGCAGARDVRSSFPRSTDPAAVHEGLATLELRFSSAVGNLLVTVNGLLVVSRADTARARVVDIPPGPTEVIVAADGLPERSFTVELTAGQERVVPMAGPGPSRTPALWQTLIGAGLTIGYLALRSAL